VKGPENGLKPLPQSVEAAVLIGTIGIVFSMDEHALEERMMLTLRKQVVALFVDRQSQQWIVRDPEGNFWFVPNVDNPWDHRQPFQPTEESDLEPVPGHYKNMLGLPF
jgi:hypothetical protein